MEEDAKTRLIPMQVVHNDGSFDLEAHMHDYFSRMCGPDYLDELPPEQVDQMRAIYITGASAGATCGGAAGRSVVNDVLQAMTERLNKRGN